jgi:hypothetical protein
MVSDHFAEKHIRETYIDSIPDYGHNSSVECRPPSTNDTKGGSIENWKSNMIDCSRSSIDNKHNSDEKPSSDLTANHLPDAKAG